MSNLQLIFQNEFSVLRKEFLDNCEQETDGYGTYFVSSESVQKAENHAISTIEKELEKFKIAYGFITSAKE